MDPLKCSPIALLVFAATPALADLTAENAFDAMIAYGNDAGLDVTTGNVSDTARGLRAADMRYVMETPEVSITMHFDEVLFDEQGDGTVRMTMSDMPLAMTVNAEGEVIEILGRMVVPGGQSILSGEPGAISTNFTYPSMAFILDSVMVDGESQDVSGEFRMENTVGSYDFGGRNDDALPVYSADYSVSKVTFEADFDIPEEEGGTGKLTGVVNGLEAKGEGTVANIASEGFPPGFRSESTLTRGPSGYDMVMSGPDGEIQFSAKDSGGQMEAGVEDGSVHLTAASQGTNINVSGTMLPMPPVEVLIGEQKMRFAMPVQPTGEVEEFGLGISLLGLEISDFLWSMLDPFNSLPHDPADIAIDLSGTGKLSVDVFDPNFNPEAMTAAPGELVSLELGEFLLRAVGAEITATGAARNMEENPLAIPRMAGALDISASGIQALMQALGQMGYLPAQQAGMANMFLGMFAVPGAEPDTFTSRIEMTEDGGILANGVPLQ